MEVWGIVLFFAVAFMAGVALLLIPSLYVTIPSSEVMFRTTRGERTSPHFLKREEF